MNAQMTGLHVMCKRDCVTGILKCVYLREAGQVNHFIVQERIIFFTAGNMNVPMNTNAITPTVYHYIWCVMAYQIVQLEKMNNV